MHLNQWFCNFWKYLCKPPLELQWGAAVTLHRIFAMWFEISFRLVFYCENEKSHGTTAGRCNKTVIWCLTRNVHVDCCTNWCFITYQKPLYDALHLKLSVVEFVSWEVHDILTNILIGGLILWNKFMMHYIFHSKQAVSMVFIWEFNWSPSCIWRTWGLSILHSSN